MIGHTDIAIAIALPGFNDFGREDHYDQVKTKETTTGCHRDIQTPRRELKIRRAAEYFFNEIETKTKE